MNTSNLSSMFSHPAVQTEQYSDKDTNAFVLISLARSMNFTSKQPQNVLIDIVSPTTVWQLPLSRYHKILYIVMAPYFNPNQSKLNHLFTESSWVLLSAKAKNSKYYF